MTGLSHEEKRQLFKRHFLLGKLSDEEIDTLLGFSRVEGYPAGREIYSKGSPGDSMMMVLLGTVKISSISSEGKEIVFNIINPGEIHGEIAVLDGGERSADAIAMTPCELLVLQRRDFMRFLGNHADMCMILLNILCQRLRQTSEQVEDVLFRHLESRMAKAVLHLASINGSREDLRLSKQELGNFAGGCRESVSKHLNEWHRAGLIRLGKESLVIRDMGAIERLI